MTLTNHPAGGWTVRLDDGTECVADGDEGLTLAAARELMDRLENRKRLAALFRYWETLGASK